jgi:hypothetical protein
MDGETGLLAFDTGAEYGTAMVFDDVVGNA